MAELINPQIIKQNGAPAFAVIPWDEYLRLVENQVEPDESHVWFPHEVVGANIRGDNLIKAWREYRGMTQENLAAKAGIKQPALARLERPDAKPRTATLKKLADAMGITVEQLVD